MASISRWCPHTSAPVILSINKRMSLQFRKLKGSKHYYLSTKLIWNTWQKFPTGLTQFNWQDHGSYHLLRPNRPLVYSVILKLNYYHKVLMFGFHVKQFSEHRGHANESVSKCHCDRVVVSALHKGTNFQSVTACVVLVANYWLTVTWMRVESSIVATLCSRSQKIMEHLPESLKNFSAKLKFSAVWQEQTSPVGTIFHRSIRNNFSYHFQDGSEYLFFGSIFPVSDLSFNFFVTPHIRK